MLCSLQFVSWQLLVLAAIIMFSLTVTSITSFQWLSRAGLLKYWACDLPSKFQKVFALFLASILLCYCTFCYTSKHEYNRKGFFKHIPFRLSSYGLQWNYTKEILMPIPWYILNSHLNEIRHGATDVRKGLSHSHSTHAFWDIITTRCFEGIMYSGLPLSSLTPQPESLPQPVPVTLAGTINLCYTICGTGPTENTLKSAIKKSKNREVNFFLCTP